MAVERIQIVVSSSGTVTVKRDIDAIGGSSKKAAAGVDMLKSALGVLGTALSVAAVIKYADAAVRLTNTLRQVGLSGEALAKTENKLYEVALRNGQNANELASVYQRLSSVQKALGTDGKGVTNAVTGIAAAMKLSTSSTAAQAGALQQLTQLFGGTKVQAEEYNSIIDGAYPIAQAAARGIFGVTGTVGQLTAAVKDGQVTTKAFFTGLQIGLVQTQAVAASLPLTIGQAFTNIGTAFQQLLGNINTTTGAFSYLAIGVNFVAQNLGLFLLALTPVIVGLTLFVGAEVLGAAIAGFGLLATVMTETVIPAFIRFTAVLYANPFIAILAGVVAVTAAILYFTDNLGAVRAGFVAIYQVGVTIWNDIIAVATPVFTSLVALVTTVYDAVVLLGQTVYEALAPSFNDFWTTVKPILEGVFDILGKVLSVLGEVVAFVGGTLISTWVGIFKRMIDSVTAVISAIISAINYMRQLIGLQAQAGQAPAAAAPGGGAPEVAPPAAGGAPTGGSGLGGGGKNGPYSGLGLQNKEQNAVIDAKNAAAAAKKTAARASLDASIAAMKAYAKPTLAFRGTGGGVAPTQSYGASLGRTTGAAAAAGGGSGSGSGGGTSRGSSGGGSSGGSSGSVTDILGALLRNSQADLKLKKEAEDRAKAGANTGAAPVNVKIENYTDPKSMLAVNQSAAGGRSIINVISENKEEIQQMLGIAP